MPRCWSIKRPRKPKRLTSRNTAEIAGDADRTRTQESVRDALPALLRERGLTQDGLAERVGVSASHLSRARRGTQYKAIGPALARRIALTFGLPDDYFPEAREGAVVALIRSDAELRDRVHDQEFPQARLAEAYNDVLGITDGDQAGRTMSE